MADHFFVQFSAAIHLKSPEEVAWCRRALPLLESVLEDNDGLLGFVWEIDEQNDLWLNDHDGWGALEHVAVVMQGYLRKFDRGGSFAVTYAESEFGGGAVFVTAEEVTYLNAHEWASDRVATWRAKKLRESLVATKRQRR